MDLSIGLAAIGAIGIVILVNDKLTENLNFKFQKMALETPIVNIKWFVEWYGGLCAIWIGLWGIIFLAGACLNVIINSEIVYYAGKIPSYIINIGLPFSLGLIITSKHINQLKEFGSKGYDIFQPITNITYFFSVSLFFLTKSFVYDSYPVHVYYQFKFISIHIQSFI